MLAAAYPLVNWIITMILIEYVYCYSAQLGRRNESQGSQVLGGAGRYGPFRQGGRTYLREPAHSVGAAQEARGLPRSQAGGAPTEECAAHRRRQASRGARPPHAQRERRNRRARAQQ